MQINLTPDWSLPVIVVIFMINYLVVRRFFFKPVNEVLLVREREVREAERRYNDSLAQFDAAAREMENQVMQAKKEGSKIREGLRAEAVQHRMGVVERTRGEAGRIVGEAARSLNSDVATAREKIVSESDALARLAAEKIVGRKIG